MKLPDSANCIIETACLETLRKLESPDDPNVLFELVGVFLQSSEARLSRLVGNLAGSDFHQIGEEAHSLKATCATLGAVALSELCKALEEAAIRKDLAETTRLVGVIELQYRVAKSELQRRVLPD